MSTKKGAFSFRIRFSIPDHVAIDIPEPAIVLWSSSRGLMNVVLSSDDGEPIKDRHEFLVWSLGYPSIEEAQTWGLKYRDWIALALAHHLIGVDYGERGPQSPVLSDVGLTFFGQGSNQRLLNDTPGLMVFEGSPDTIFIKSEISVKVTRKTDDLVEIMQEARAKNTILMPRQRLALALYGASTFQSSLDTRFLLLMMAAEALMEPPSRSANAWSHVKKLIELTRNSAELLPSERNSLVGSLKWLMNESISHTGQRLAMTLSDRLYGGMPPPKFFKYCYSMRSNLVHGRVPPPSWTEINASTGALELLVRDLLSMPLKT